MISMKTKYIRAAVIAVGAIFIVLGITRGEPGTVFTKAVNICMECIGIG